MGCDGGTIPRRDELVRLKKKPEQKDKEAELQYRWRHCALTQQRLQEPIIMCGLGRLYTKQNIIEVLLEKEKMPESANHIKSLKDIKDLHLTPNPAFASLDEKNKYENCSAPYICGLIGLEMTGKFRFIALWTCGCVFSERAFKEIKGNICSLCQKPYKEEDVVILNGNEEDTDLMRVKMDARVARRKCEKKDKKSKTSTVTITSTVTSTEIEEPSQDSLLDTNSKIKLVALTSTSTTAASKLFVKPNCIEPASASTSKIAVKTLKRPGKDEKYADPAFKKSKESYSVAKDPKASDVYKSLFTSHHTEKDQTRAHWVTYNPFYN